MLPANPSIAMASHGIARSGRPSVRAVVAEAFRSPGHRLDSGSRAYFEPRFRHDFASVRVHEDDVSRRSCAAFGASAWTLGRDVFLDDRASSSERLAALAHELAH